MILQRRKQIKVNTVTMADCLEAMRFITDKSIDMILCDLPYGTTACKWDVVIPFEPLWAQYKRLIKENGAIVLFGSEPFSSYLRLSNLVWFKYDWIWDKKIPAGMSYAKHRPMAQTEIISVFCSGKHRYNPQMLKRTVPIYETTGSTKTDHRGGNAPAYLGGKIYTEKNPTTLLTFPKVPNCLGTLHPTQKPVTLFEYLIRTYTNEGDTVLDNCAGSGTTAIACIRTNRKYILIEKEQKYFDIINQRIKIELKKSKSTFFHKYKFEE